MYCGTELHANCELIFAYTKEFSLSPKNYVVDYYRLRKSVKKLNKRRWATDPGSGEVFSLTSFVHDGVLPLAGVNVLSRFPLVHVLSDYLLTDTHTHRDKQLRT